MLIVLDNYKGKKRLHQSYGMTPKQIAKRKKVSFGGTLSPELFDLHLPPSTPVKRGATPKKVS